MLKKYSITKTFIFHMVIVIVLVIVLLDSLIIYQEYSSFETEAKKLREDFLIKQKINIRNEVYRIISYIEYRRNMAELETRNMISMKTDIIFNAVQRIYNKYRGFKTDIEIKRILFRELKDLDSNDGSYYLYVFNKDGRALMTPELKNEKLQKKISFEESSIISRIIKKNKNKMSDFNSYFWDVTVENNDRGGTGETFYKTGYIRMFSPYDWYIGIGEHVDYVTRQVKREVLGWIGKIKFGNNQYFFIDKFNGRPLIHDGKLVRFNKNGKELGHSKADKLFMSRAKDIIKRGGGYIYYPAMKADKGQYYEKISYIKGFKDWQWLVGAGVFLEDLEKHVAAKRTELEIDTLFHIIKIIILLVVFIIVTFFIASFIAIKARKSFDAFYEFFEKASVESIRIKSSEMDFKEFEILAHSANRMIDKRNEVEFELKQSRKRFKDIAESVADWIWETDKDYKYTYVSGKVEEILGYTPAEMIGKTPFDFYLNESDDSKEKPNADIIGLINLEKPIIDHEKWSKNKDDKSVWLLTNGVPIYDENGIISGYRGVSRDITEKKLAEIELNKHRTHLEELVVERSNELAIKQAQLTHSGKLAALGEMAAGMAHEINQPLSTISFVMKNMLLATEQKNNEIDNEYLLKKTNKVLKSVDRIANIINHIRVFSRDQSNKVYGNISFNIVESIANAISLVSQQYIHHGITLEFKNSFKRLNANGDLYRFEQVILNLLSNAKYAVEKTKTIVSENYKPTIEVKTEKSEHTIIVHVKDNGIGMSEDLCNKIMEPFYTTKDPGEGTGLGLSISYGIIKDMGGDITFKSVENEWTLVTVTVPELVKS
ncbi:MAG: PAS domain S-box protein [bacterium]|nr:PAS domain S-box protein [bacterium]